MTEHDPVTVTPPMQTDRLFAGRYPCRIVYPGASCCRSKPSSGHRARSQGPSSLAGRHRNHTYRQSSPCRTAFAPELRSSRSAHSVRDGAIQPANMVMPGLKRSDSRKRLRILFLVTNELADAGAFESCVVKPSIESEQYPGPRIR